MFTHRAIFRLSLKPVKNQYMIPLLCHGTRVNTVMKTHLSVRLSVCHLFDSLSIFYLFIYCSIYIAFCLSFCLSVNHYFRVYWRVKKHQTSILFSLTIKHIVLVCPIFNVKWQWFLSGQSFKDLFIDPGKTYTVFISAFKEYFIELCLISSYCLSRIL